MEGRRNRGVLHKYLQRKQRAFIKPIRYYARSAAGFPDVLLLESGTLPMQLHVMSPLMEAKERSAKEKVLAGLHASWVWTTTSMPVLPARW